MTILLYPPFAKVHIANCIVWLVARVIYDQNDRY